MREINLTLKRFFDFVVSLYLFVLLIPIFVIFSIIIKFTSRGPVFFKQKRLGKNGKEFKIIKFRTMVNNAEQMGLGIKTSENDPRVTRIGGFLRKTSLDELPQLINILKGEMSLIGPRPPVPYHPHNYEEYSTKQKKRFKMKPGITGYAQVKGRNKFTWDERIQYDIKYVNKFSILLDIYILILTFAIVLARKSVHSGRNN